MSPQKFNAMKKLSLLIACLIALDIQAQPALFLAEMPSGGIFFACLIAGVLLALAFQSLLTALSVATGVSLIPDPRKIDTTHSKTGHREGHEDEDISLGVKISTGAGIWGILTMSISLFFASLLAVKFSFAPDNSFGAPMGLVIWGAFTLMIFYLEWKSATSLFGTIAKTAFSGLRSVGSAVSGIFSSSREKEARHIRKDTVDHTLDEIQKRLDINWGKAEDKLDEVVKRLQPKETKASTIRKELKKLLEQIRVDKEYVPGHEDLIVEYLVETGSRNKAMGKKHMKKIKDAAKEIASEGTNKGKAKKAMDALMAGDGKTGNEVRENVKQFLDSLQTEQLSSKALSDDLEQILDHPSRAREVALNRIRQIDHGTIVHAVAAKTGKTEPEVEEIAQKLEQFLNKWIAKKDGATRTGKDKMKDTQYQVLSYLGKYEDGMRDFFNAIGREEFDYARLKSDIRKVFDKEYSASRILKNRMKEYDMESLKALLATHTSLSREQVEEASQKISDYRKEFIRKVDEIENEIRDKAGRAKEKSLEIADDTRKTVMTAAWFTVATLVISGIASALGGALAYTW